LAVFAQLAEAKDFLARLIWDVLLLSGYCGEVGRRLSISCTLQD
jgi:hypothetical protein